MIDAAEARPQVRRLAQLKDYPSFAPEAEADLIRVAAENADSLEQLSTVITRVVDDSALCPKPSELRQMLRPPAAPFTPTDLRRCPVGKCDGTGWQREFWLHTMERQGRSFYTRKERISEEQYRGLWGQIDPKRGNQTLHEGVRRCSCRVPEEES